MPSPSQSSRTDSENESSFISPPWWRWRSVPVSVIGENEKKSIERTSPPSPSITHSVMNSEGRSEDKAPPDQVEMSGWDRIRELYETESMEKDLVQRIARASFLGGFLYGGTSGYLLAKQQYEIANKGRKYLSPSDAVVRRLDYAIIRYAMKGFSFGAKAAFISGSIVLLSTHTATLRRKFSSLYLPAYSALVGGVFMFPAGVLGAAKAFGLGITSGLTLSAVCGLYAISTERSVDSAYWHLKKEYEAELREEGAFERRVVQVMDEQKVWRYQALKIVKEEEEEKLKNLDA
ncbi:hypothetical protein PENTCL1PPCAC_17927 [Pristionchus entomophagus]|uniref:Complex I assembly factor TIMMDC1, mitochondrial n=1 Tax=Pristionchus entomophagus TaxID=358040 RepID=A0AAV5TNC2_9BILA|nr:hypothetical protein PENTCL1PPCAC_17927 [Pristionchus entomophagus]